MSPTIVQEIRMFVTEGTTDKEYRVELIQSDAGFSVMGRNGRRGAALIPRPQKPADVSLEQAQSIYDKLVKSKKKDGYTEDESGVRYALSDKDGRISGWRAQLLTELAPEQEDAFINDDFFGMQEKHNGERRGIDVLPGGEVLGMNKKGLYVPIPQPWVDALQALPAGTRLDGEAVGDKLYLFDIVKHGDQAIGHSDFNYRAGFLKDLVAKLGCPSVVYSPVARARAEKLAMREKLTTEHREGWVYKDLQSSYSEGRSASVVDANALKFKIKATASFIVESHHATKNSVNVALLNEQGVKEDLGNVTIPQSAAMPPVGSVVEVQFVYRFAGGKLDQPVYLHQRHDVEPGECVASQIVRIRHRMSDLEEAAIEADAEDGADQAEAESCEQQFERQR